MLLTQNTFFYLILITNLPDSLELKRHYTWSELKFQITISKWERNQVCISPPSYHSLKVVRSMKILYKEWRYINYVYTWSQFWFGVRCAHHTSCIYRSSCSFFFFQISVKDWKNNYSWFGILVHYKRCMYSVVYIYVYERSVYNYTL